MSVCVGNRALQATLWQRMRRPGDGCASTSQVALHTCGCCCAASCRHCWHAQRAAKTRAAAALLRAGLLVTDDKKEPSRLRSLVLLLGRLLMTSLFVYVGVVQVSVCGPGGVGS